MNTEEIGQITYYLDKIAHKIGVASNKVWPWFIRQVYIDSIISWIWLMASLTMFILVLNFSTSHWERSPKENWYSIVDSDHEGIWLMVMAILAILLVISTINMVIEGFGFLNPEYRALRNLIQMVKGR